jgi:hypothetical protein
MSETSICNRALQILGADSITALTDDNNRAREMTRAYQPLRDAEIERHKWRFSLKRASIAALSAAPAFGYARQFQVPTDFIALVSGGDLTGYADLTDYRGSSDEELFSLEGNVILTNLDAPLNIAYKARITDTNLFPPSFAELLAARIADETCERITQSDSKRSICMDAYKRALREARQSNAVQVANRSAADTEWVMGRTQ